MVKRFNFQSLRGGACVSLGGRWMVCAAESGPQEGLMCAEVMGDSAVMDRFRLWLYYGTGGAVV